MAEIDPVLYAKVDRLLEGMASTNATMDAIIPRLEASIAALGTKVDRLSEALNTNTAAIDASQAALHSLESRFQKHVESPVHDPAPPDPILVASIAAVDKRIDDHVNHGDPNPSKVKTVTASGGVAAAVATLIAVITQNASHVADLFQK